MFKGVISAEESMRASGTEKDVQLRNAFASNSNSAEQNVPKKQRLLAKAHVHGTRSWHSVKSQVPRWPDITEWMYRRTAEVRSTLDINEGSDIDQGKDINESKERAWTLIKEGTMMKARTLLR